ncbi:MAG: AraC family transcriptional regulator ligand-binding domain-containing protein [Alcanivoracaceae bacterium]
MASLVTPSTNTALECLPGWTRIPGQSATYPRMFAEVAARHGVPSARLLEHAGLPAELLDDPAGRVSLQDIWRLLDTLMALTDNPSLAFEAGLQMPLTAHGSLGYALMCAGSPRQAIDILRRFWHLRGRGFLLTVDITRDGLFFEVAPEANLPERLREFQLSAILTSMYRSMQFMMPMLKTDDEIWLQGPTPKGFEHYRSQLPEVRFTMPRPGISLRGDLAALDQPLPTANPEALKQALLQCERDSALLDQGDDIVRRVRAALVHGADGYPSRDQLAGELHLSPRTFRRRLQDQGHSYQSLLDQARRRDSLTLLRNPALEVRQIAGLLGYSDPANFTRAFRQWTGLAPRQWRQRS